MIKNDFKLPQPLTEYATSMPTESATETVRLCMLRINAGDEDTDQERDSECNQVSILQSLLIELSRGKGEYFVNELMAEIMQEIVSTRDGFNYTNFVRAGVLSLPTSGSRALYFRQKTN